uniref:Uncharacterized protein n=1 Tax=Nymphaea colorata TaxID=210225 RepID=A0A5K1GWJ8_9MAGN
MCWIIDPNRVYRAAQALLSTVTVKWIASAIHKHDERERERFGIEEEGVCRQESRRPLALVPTCLQAVANGSVVVTIVRERKERPTPHPVCVCPPAPLFVQATKHSPAIYKMARTTTAAQP